MPFREAIGSRCAMSGGPSSRPEGDRRSLLVVLTTRVARPWSTRRRHRHAIEQHFSRHLADTDIKALTRPFAQVSPCRPLRPGRIRS
jgi:hypothetical protein